jgi:hypothetical protein
MGGLSDLLKLFVLSDFSNSAQNFCSWKPNFLNAPFIHHRQTVHDDSFVSSN